MKTLPLKTRPLTRQQAVAVSGAPCYGCGADLSTGRVLFSKRRPQGWTDIFLYCTCGRGNGLRYQLVRRKPEAA